MAKRPLKFRSDNSIKCYLSSIIFLINESKDLYLFPKFKKFKWLRVEGQREVWEYAEYILNSSPIFGISKIIELFEAAGIYLLALVIIMSEEFSF